jgi:3-hydroxyisobutyrate dehydrogenase-like beta-hydroxyacid dehydrogenase
MSCGWIGVGNMGRPMIEKILDSGHPMTLCDISDEAFAPLGRRPFSRAASPRALGDGCAVVFFCLPSLAATRAAILGPDGVIAGRAVELVVNVSTIGTALVEEIAAAAADRGIGVVDCPISGGPEAARAAALSVMVSGDAARIERIRPLLETFAAKITVAGDRPGAAQVLKLVNNLVILTAYVGTLEAIVLGAKAGLDVDVMLGAINAGMLAPNGTTRCWLPDYILRDRAFGGKLLMMVKDLEAALAEGTRFEAPLPLAELATDMARRAVAEGLGERDIIAFAEVVEAAAGFRLPRVPLAEAG